MTALRRERGFTMVEVLVALAVLAIGLLGIAALYLDSLRAGRTAIYRTQAVNLAADLGDRIRANRGAVVSYEAALADDPDTVPACDSGGPCTRDEMAQNDLAVWKDSLAALLPAGEGSVAVTPGNPSVYVITVQWTEPGTDGALTYSLTVET